jgi:cyclohexa-1,5-dienecarbonyl-CoA hydratase
MALKVEVRRGVCELRLAAPPGNVIDTALCGDLAAAVRSHGRDPRLKAFLLAAEGKHFSYGASVPEHEAGKVEKFLPAFHDVFLQLTGAGVPLVAAVRGLCLGGAFELVAFGSFVVAEETARFAAPEVRLGVFPPAACVILPWRVGGARAEEMVLLGREVPAAEAHAWGLVTRTCPPGELEAATERFLDEAIRPRSAAALRHAHRAVRRTLDETLCARLRNLERLYLEDLMETRDAKEGIRAFLEKREPVWTDG